MQLTSSATSRQPLDTFAFSEPGHRVQEVDSERRENSRSERVRVPAVLLCLLPWWRSVLLCGALGSGPPLAFVSPPAVLLAFVFGSGPFWRVPRGG